MNKPKVTIIVSQRERFSYTRESLESIYENTHVPFSLVYIDGNSPPKIAGYLEEQARQKEFDLIRTEYYLSPNQARNLGLHQVKTEYVVFIDNDVIVAPGWLDHLLQCAEETKATVVCPLTCIGEPLGETIHLAGGEAHIVVETQEHNEAKRRVHEKHYFVNRKVAEVRNQLHRQQCEFAEFHCMLVRTEIFEQIGLLDEGLLSTREHIDFCLTVTNAGGTVYCEPASIVTYVPGLKLQIPELVFFMLRWSDAWEIASLEHFAQKWQLTTKDKYFKKRYKRMGHRRHQAFLKPLLHRLTFGTKPLWLEKWAISLEKKLNQYISDRYTPNHTSYTQSVAQSDKAEHELVSL
ncbi:glycosyl transferase family 2 [Fischerella thermalis CCMEE 5208]|jgi:GT2 family glycosyltransferase|uniref:glycosyltransferase family 2 protein n=1 Tax=Fischerella thermalis TaxID=372787 RepID=UPI000C80F646|nr:glycosyltransferase [Fischerella thermalis]PMB33934.1 glycosyl transferase family 2 [Fischerella thermalis CCMEE 5208]